MNRKVALFSCLVVLAALFGCGSKPAKRAPVSVSGQVLDTAGKPLAMKVVSFNPQEADQKDAATGTDAQGKFSIQVVPGLYHVTLAEPGHAPNGGADGSAGGVTGPDKLGKIQGVPSIYRNANDTPWKPTIPANGQSDLILQIAK